MNGIFEYHISDTLCYQIQIHGFIYSGEEKQKGFAVSNLKFSTIFSGVPQSVGELQFTKTC